MASTRERHVRDSTLRVEYSHDLPAVTAAGPIRSWKVTITAPDLTHEARVGIASPSDEVSEQLFATIIDMGLLTIQPGSRDNDPFAAAKVRAWVEENRDALRALVTELRASRKQAPP
jgi:hypothetical protein